MTGTASSAYLDLLFEGNEPQYHEITSKLRLRRHDDLLVAEAAELEQLDRDRVQATIHLIQVAKRCSQEKGISVQEAFELLQQGTQDPAKSALVQDYLEDMAVAYVGVPLQVMNEVRLITLFLKTRGEVCRGKKWEPIQAWQRDDTMRLTNKLRLKVVDFINNEKEGWPAPGKKDEGAIQKTT
jgi:hypothetical protein